MCQVKKKKNGGAWAGNLQTSFIRERLEDPLELLILKEELGWLLWASAEWNDNDTLADTLNQVIHGAADEDRGFTAPIMLSEELRDANSIPLLGRSPGQMEKIRESQEGDLSYCDNWIDTHAGAAPTSAREGGWAKS